MDDQTGAIARRYLDEVGAVLRALPFDRISQIVDVLRRARREGKRVFLFGNGGSSATASHFACDLNKGANVSGAPRFKAVSLTDNVPLLCAWANDSAYEDIFVEQLENHLSAGDVAIGISGSGNSPNVVKALKMAREKGATTIALTAFDGGKVKDIAHLCLIAPTHCMEQAEDAHLVLEHLITTCLRKLALSPGPD